MARPEWRAELFDDLNLRFYNFPNPGAAFSSARQLRLNTEDPQLIRVKNAILSPARTGKMSANPDHSKYKMLGGVYSQSGDLLAASRMAQEVDQFASTDEPNIATSSVSVKRRIEIGVYLGWYVSHHGHFLIESLSRLWCAEKLADHPDVKFLFHFAGHNRGKGLHPDHVKILSLLSIPEHSVEFIDDWTTVDVLLMPTQAQSLNHYTHPDFASLYQHISGKVAGPSDNDLPEKIYISRQNLNFFQNRPFNEVEIEGLMRDHGFEIIYPERMDIIDQIRTFANARVICGYLGSGLYNAVFCNENSHVILMCGEPNPRPPLHHFLIARLTNTRLSVLNSVVPLEYWKGCWIDGRVVDRFLRSVEGVSQSAGKTWDWWPETQEPSDQMERQIMFHHAVFAACLNQPERYRPLMQRLVRYSGGPPAALDLIAVLWSLCGGDAQLGELSRHLVSLTAWTLGIFEWDDGTDLDVKLVKKLNEHHLSPGASKAYSEILENSGFQAGATMIGTGQGSMAELDKAAD